MASCQNLVDIPDFRADLVLPASGDCYGKTVVSQKSQRIPANDSRCLDIKRKSILLTPDQYAIIKKSWYKLCIKNECKQAVSVVDDLFLSLDAGVKAVYGGSK